MSTQSATEDYGFLIVRGLNKFLDHLDHSVSILESDVSSDGMNTLVIGFDTDGDDSYPDPNETHRFTDMGHDFQFGLAEDTYLIIETNITNTDDINVSEHVGEAVTFLIGQSDREM